jgi:cytochrome c biogenesis protein CcdA
MDLPPPIDSAGTLGDVPLGPVDELSNPPPKQEIQVPLFGTLRVKSLGLPAFTFLVGLVDGFNPCAMWVLIFLLSVLVNVNSRAKMFVIAGTFVLVSGLAYFAFMAAWLNVFMLIGYTRKAQIALGVVATFVGIVNVKDFFAFKKGFSFSIPESAKPGIAARVRNIVMTKYLTVALTGAIVLAVVVNVIELLCTAGLPAMYTEILTLQQLPAWENYGYLALYNVAYMFDDSIMLCIAVVTLSKTRLQEKEGRWLKLISGLVILALGLAMLCKPEWLSW